MVDDGVPPATKNACRQAVTVALKNGVISEDYEHPDDDYVVQFLRRERIAGHEYSVFLIEFKNELKAGYPVGGYTVKRSIRKINSQHQHSWIWTEIQAQEMEEEQSQYDYGWVTLDSEEAAKFLRDAGQYRKLDEGSHEIHFYPDIRKESGMSRDDIMEIHVDDDEADDCKRCQRIENNVLT